MRMNVAKNRKSIVMKKRNTIIPILLYKIVWIQLMLNQTMPKLIRQILTKSNLIKVSKRPIGLLMHFMATKLWVIQITNQHGFKKYGIRHMILWLRGVILTQKLTTQQKCIYHLMSQRRLKRRFKKDIFQLRNMNMLLSIMRIFPMEILSIRHIQIIRLRMITKRFLILLRKFSQLFLMMQIVQFLIFK